MLFGLIPISAISISGIQIAEIMVLAAFLFEISLIRSLRQLIFCLSIIIAGVLLGGINLSALSQVVKALLIPLLALRFSIGDNFNFKLRVSTHKKNSNINILILFLLLISSILNVRLSNSFYIDGNSGLFRHSVDFAFFILLSLYSISTERKIIIVVFYILSFIAIFLGGSRSILLLLPLYIFMSRPVPGLVIIILGYILFKYFSSSVIPLLPDKIGNIISLVIFFDLKEILYDSSLEVRIRNFTQVFSQMDWFDLLLGFSRERVLSITSAVSFGDVSTDNIVLYKIVFFGFPFGIFISLFFLISIYYISGSKMLVFVLFIYGMLQDWNSNAFCIFVMYLTFLSIRTHFKPIGVRCDIAKSRCN